MTPSDSCELCGRRVSFLTRHHLVPRTRHANKRNKREFDRKDVKQRLAWLCRPCHNQIHALFTEKMLEREFNTLQALAAHTEVAKFVKWIQGKPEGFKPISEVSNGKRTLTNTTARHW